MTTFEWDDLRRENRECEDAISALRRQLAEAQANADMCRKDALEALQSKSTAWNLLAMRTHERDEANARIEALEGIIGLALNHDSGHSAFVGLADMADALAALDKPKEATDAS